MGLLNRNFITNLGGLALTFYGGNELANGKMTIEKLLATAPAAIVSFATGSKDKNIEALLKLNGGDKVAANDITRMILDRFASRFNLTVTPRHINIPEVNHDVITDVPNNDYRGSGRFDSTSEPTPEQRASQYFSEQVAAGRRLPHIPQAPIEGTDTTPMRFAMESMSGDEETGTFKGQGEW
jgi:hypothetical protein